MPLGPYEITGELGRGGMGVVYRARHSALGHEVALKVMHGDVLDPVTVARFAREARATARLADHPGIVAVRDLGTSDQGPWLAMELVDGRALDACIDEEGSLPPRDVAEIGVGIARAVAYAHANGIIHRDLKPANVLIDAGGTARVTDFGLASTHRLDGETQRLTLSGTVVGTPAYMPPEQIRDEPLDARADVYALGATLYEACAGHPPFGAGAISSLLVKVLRDPVPPLRASAPDVPGPLAAIIEHCLERERDHRYPSAEAVAEDLERFLRGEAPLGARTARRPERRGLRVAVAVGVGVTLLGATLWGLRQVGVGGAARVEDAHTADTLATAAQRQTAAYTRLLGATGPAMQRLEDHWRGHPLAEGRAATAAADVATSARAIGRALDTPALAEAWAALAALYAGGTPEPLEQAIAGSHPEPLAVLVAAVGRLACWGRTVRLAGVQADRGNATARFIVDDAEGVPHRARAVALVEALAADPRFAQLTQRGAARALVAAVRSLNAGAWRSAADHFAEAAADPLLEGLGRSLEGVLRLLGGDPVNAGAAWERLTQRGWPHAAEYAVICYSIAAQVAEPDGPVARSLLDRAAALLDRELAAAPTEPRLLRLYSELWKERAWQSLQAGHNPMEAYQASITYAERAAAAAPQDAELLGIVGELYRQVAQSSPLWGLDPRPPAARAIAVLERARALPEAPPLVSLQLALALQLAVELAPGDPANAARLERAQSEIAIALADDSPVLRPQALGVAGANARALAEAARDPARKRALLDQALAAYDEVLEHHADDHEARIGRSSAWADLAALARRLGEDPTPAFEHAQADLTMARAARPDFLPVGHNLTLLLLDRARADAEQGTDPAPRLAEAAEIAGDLTRSHAQAAGAWELRGLVWERRGDLLAGHPDARAAAYREAATHYGHAVELEPGRASGWYSRGNLSLELALLAPTLGEDPEPHWAAAERDYTAAIDAQPRSARYRYNRAYCRLQRAERIDDTDVAHPYYVQALEDLDAAVAMDPAKVEAWHNRAAVLVRLGQLDEALASCERALALDPDLRASQELRAEIRRRLR